MRLKKFTELPKILKVVKRGKFKNRRMAKFKELKSNEISKVAKYRNLFFSLCGLFSIQIKIKISTMESF